MKSTYELLTSKYGTNKYTEEYMNEYWYAVSGKLQIGGLSVYINADTHPVHRDKDITVEGDIPDEGRLLEAYIQWNSSSKGSKAAYFPVNQEGLKQACSWLDEKRQEFAKKIIDGIEY